MPLDVRGACRGSGQAWEPGLVQLLPGRLAHGSQISHVCNRHDNIIQLTQLSEGPVRWAESSSVQLMFIQISRYPHSDAPGCSVGCVCVHVPFLGMKTDA